MGAICDTMGEQNVYRSYAYTVRQCFRYRRCFYGVSQSFIFQRGGAPASPTFLGPYLRPYGLTSNQIWHGNTCGVEAYFEGSATALSQGAGPERPSNFGTSYVRAHRETATKFCTAIELDARKILHGRPRMLTRDLFAVANLLITLRAS